jgi:hypothetical protein
MHVYVYTQCVRGRETQAQILRMLRYEKRCRMLPFTFRLCGGETGMHERQPDSRCTSDALTEAAIIMAWATASPTSLPATGGACCSCFRRSCLVQTCVCVHVLVVCLFMSNTRLHLCACSRIVVWSRVSANICNVCVCVCVYYTHTCTHTYMRT